MSIGDFWHEFLSFISLYMSYKGFVMKFLKSICRRIFDSLGYEMRRSSDVKVSFNNFANLAQAYEQRLNESNNTAIQANETRSKLLARLEGTPPSEAYFIIQALETCKKIEGDVCEFGVAQGETSALIANEICQSNKILHLFDSFEGLPRPSDKDQLKNDIFALGSMEAYTGTMSCPEDMVRSRLKSISFPPERVVIHKGFIDKILLTDSNLPHSVSFAYVDFDFYEPLKLAFEFLHRTTSIGSIIVVDDYDYFSTGAKSAVDEFLREKNSTETSYECLVPNVKYGYFAILTRQCLENQRNILTNS